MRSLVQILQQESPISLAREAVWRSHKNWTKKRILAQLNTPSAVTFRDIPYYRPIPSLLSKTTQELVTAFADQICAGKYPFLGYGTLDLGLRPPWNCDFVSGLDWPNIPLDNRDCMRFDGSDVKVPYELSRLQFLPVLGKAHVLTSDNRYRDTARALLSSWIEDNPIGVGVNWSLAMEVALRGMSICFLLNLLAPFRAEEESWLTSATHSLWQHLVYVEAHIEFSHLISSNHYLGNIVGLYCLSSFLEGPRMAKRRAAYRLRIEAELRRQVYEDGGDYEGSTGYHALVAQMFTTVLLLIRANGDLPESQFLQRVRNMHRILAALASPSGDLPQIGDCDDGRIEILLDDMQQMLQLPVSQRNSLRISNLLGLGKSLFEEGRGSTEDAKWYGLDHAVHRPRAVSVPPVDLFPHSGIAVARTGPAELFFFAVPNGINGKGSHNHNDKLSVTLRLDGAEILCDSGTGSYTRDIAFRNRFRLTAAHNTVMVDNREQCTIEFTRSGLFRLGTEATVSPIQHMRQGQTNSLQASHLGYAASGITHSRSVRWHDGEGKIYLEDHLDGIGLHAVELNFQIASPWRVIKVTDVDSGVRCSVEGPRPLDIFVSAPCMMRAQQCEVLISRTYGCTTSASRIRFWGEVELPTTILTELAWAI